jgi:PAS domain S-box-containing protein
LKDSSGFAIAGMLLVGIKLSFLHFGNGFPAELRVLVENCALTLLIGAAAWRASKRSFLYAQVFWRCVIFVALLWTANFGVAALALISGRTDSPSVAGWPIMVINSFPLGIALMVPLLLREDRKELKIGWLQALDIAQIGLIVFAIVLAFFYIPSLAVASDVERLRYFRGLHLMRDGFLAVGYLYRGWRSSSSDLRKLHFQMSGFLIAYGLTAVLAIHAHMFWHWPVPLAYLMADVPLLGLLAMAATWRQQNAAPHTAAVERKDMIWTQVLALILPASVVALASRASGQHLRAAWILVTASFFLYALRLLVMQRQQNKILTSLAAMEERFSKAFKSSPAAIVISRLSDGTIIDANDRWLGLMNLTRAKAIGRNSVELGIFANTEKREKVMGPLRTCGSVRGINLKLNLKARTLETLASAEVIELGGEPLIISSFLDVTEFTNLKQQLQQAQKMQLIGNLAGGVAHDFNNLLTIITGYSGLALSRSLDAQSEEEILRIKEASAKAAALTHQLLAFSRRQVLSPRNLSLNAVVTPIEKLLQRTIGDHIEMITSLDADAGTVYADPVQIEQVVMNLAVNARDAMPLGGTLIFATKNLDLIEAYPGKGFEIPPGRYVMLIVADTGTGIPPDNLDRIFEPFFTTKGVGAGTGLGLSTVYGIVKQSGGWIWADSDVGVGTSFKVCLPRVDLPADVIQVNHHGLENLTGKGTVLVVDDDSAVCELAAKVLDQYGYQVITATSGEDAKRWAQDSNQEIHLLITDVVMSKTSGKQLAQHLKDRRPDLKILYMSGYPHVSLSGEEAADLCASILAKPFDPADLAREAKRVLNDSC